MKEKRFITCDGNAAASHVAYMFTEVAAIYPITPSSPMAENVDEWSAGGRKNMFGETVLVQEMQSEAGAAGTVHGSLSAGVLTTTFTASQGLLLMIPNMYKIAGELLPTVFHVSARTLASHVLCIFGDHQDVMACRQTGFAMLCEGSVQEVMDLSGVAHLSTIKSRVPFLNFFDGFRTSHEYQKIEAIDMEDLRGLVDWGALEAFRGRSMSPMRPTTRGMNENPDVFFAHRESCNRYYDAVPDIVNAYMEEISRITGRCYAPFTFYGHPEADSIIICMGSVCETIKEVIDYENSHGKRYGLVSVHLYRPFSIKYLQKVLPDTVRRICVLDRTKEPGAGGEPLYLDVRSALCEMGLGGIKVIGGRYGLGSNDTTPAQILAVYANLTSVDPKDHFTVGINDDLTCLSLPCGEEVAMGGDGIFQAKFYGIGADGTVGANKNSVKIIGDSTDKYCQAYFSYDSKKSGGFTCSHLRFGDSPIRSTYLVTTPNFVACHVQAYLQMYDVTRGLQDNGIFLLNTVWSERELVANLPNRVKKYFADHHINVYYINATKIAQEIGLGNRTNTILQSAFFRITGVIEVEKAISEMKHFIVKSYGNKGEDVVNKNYAAVDRGGEYKRLEVDASWSKLSCVGEEFGVKEGDSDFVRELVRPINAQNGDLLPVSVFKGREDGVWENGTSKYEKRGVSAFVPRWNADNCIECNKCSYVCPHASIRPFVLSDDELKESVVAGLSFATREMKAPMSLKGMHFRMQVDVMDCLGCGNCVDVCPGNPKTGKALEMVDSAGEVKEGVNWDYCVGHVRSKQEMVDVYSNVKNSQFATPLFEFSGACAGCGETPYLKLISQLFGDREMVGNATGCSSIYSAAVPSTPYTCNALGRGPAWSNSLFEDFCEFALGMQIAHRKMRERIVKLMREAIANGCSDAMKVMFERWIEHQNEGEETKRLYSDIVNLLEGSTLESCREILRYKDHLIKRSQWAVGGDGASYDIGYGGLDHVIASGEDVNILVLDTEVYSNTGGQASKSTPVGAIAKFAAMGKRVRKKDLGMIATTYGYVYVAQIAMGADQSQTLRVLKEAEAYPGPSLIIAYAPCINHGLRSGMGKSQEEERRAVECGYWHLWHYNPLLEKEGKNPFKLDSGVPQWDKFQDFLKGEVRFSSLAKQYPKEAAELFRSTELNALWRYKSYLRMEGGNWSE